MDHLQWYDYIRLATAVLALAAAFRLTRVVRKREEVQSPLGRSFLWLIFAFLLLEIINALDTIVNNDPWRYLVLIRFFIMVVAIRATTSSDKPLFI